jgi:catecholate siderophore receptor
MAFRKTKPALLVALALQQLSSPSFAQTAGPVAAAANNNKADVEHLPEVKVQGQSINNDYAPGVSTVGGKTLTPIRDIPQSLTVVNRAVLDAQGAASLQEALRNVPGITIGGAEGGQIGNNINLRGFTARTDIFLDGMRDRGQYYRDTYYLESVEVLKGPSSMLFGRGSTGGIINQARKQPQLNGQDEVTATIGSHGYLRSTADLNRRLSDTSAFRVEMMGQDIKSTRDVMSNQDYGIAPSLRLGIGTPTEITLSALVAHNRDMPDYGVLAVNGRPLDVPRNTFYGLTDDRTVQDVGILSARIEHKISPNLTLRNQTQYSNYRTDARETYPNNVGTFSGGVFTPLATASTGNYTGLPLSQLSLRLVSHDRVIKDQSLNNQTDLIAKFDTGAIKHTLVAGAELSRDLYDNQTTSRNNLPVISVLNPAYGATPGNSVTSAGNLGKGDATSFGAYINDTLELNKQWKVVGGVRWDRFKANVSNTVSTSTPPIYAASQAVNFTSVRGGVIYQPTDTQSYYASYGTSFNPSLEQLTVTSGQQNVAPEKNRSYEIGAKWDVFDGKLSLTSALFNIQKTNARSLVSPGVYQLDGDVRVTGFEVGAAGHITRNWQLIGGYTHLNPSIVKASAADGTQGKVLANTPRNSATLWSTYNLTPQWEVGGGFTYLSERYASNTNVVSADGYVRWDATVAYHQPKYDIRFNLLNVTNKQYIDSLIPSDGGRGVPGVGRTALVTVAYRF